MTLERWTLDIQKIILMAQKSKRLFSFYILVSYKLSAGDGEIEAIKVALNQNQITLHVDKFISAVIISNLKTAIQSSNKTQNFPPSSTESQKLH